MRAHLGTNPVEDPLGQHQARRPVGLGGAFLYLKFRHVMRHKCSALFIQFSSSFEAGLVSGVFKLSPDLVAVSAPQLGSPAR
jgi:hypothetical protein